MQYCQYYQGNVKRDECWFFVGAMRSFEHMSFDRTLDLSSSLFEFFVPEVMENQFLKIMDFFKKQGIVTNLKKLPNRLLDSAELV
jgi:hypothetical protein